MNNKIILRCSTDGVVNIPKETYKEIGWKLNEPVEIAIATIPYVNENDDVMEVNEICVRRVKDLPILDKTEDDDEEWKRQTKLIFKHIKNEEKWGN